MLQPTAARSSLSDNSIDTIHNLGCCVAAEVMYFYFLLLASLAQASFLMTSRDRWVIRNFLVVASPAFGSSEVGSISFF
jgi:hypothetical protein